MIEYEPQMANLKISLDNCRVVPFSFSKQESLCYKHTQKGYGFGHYLLFSSLKKTQKKRINETFVLAFLDSKESLPRVYPGESLLFWLRRGQCRRFMGGWEQGSCGRTQGVGWEYVRVRVSCSCVLDCSEEEFFVEVYLVFLR